MLQDAATQHHVLAAADDWLLQHGRSCALFVALKETPAAVYKDPFEEKVLFYFISLSFLALAFSCNTQTDLFVEIASCKPKM